MAESTSSLKARLDAAHRRREDLSQKVQRILGRLDESERTLEAIKAECRNKKIDPDQMDDAIQRMEVALQSSIEEYETKITTAEAAVAPFTR